MDFMQKNICNFIPYHKDYHSIHTINFVLETKQQLFTSLKSQAIYKLHYVCGGSGNLHITGKVIPLSKGDIFFTFPAMPFCIESVENFSYMYISFLGNRTNLIMEKLKISNYNFLFHDCEEIYEFWKKGLNSNPDISDLITESILLYTFSFIGNRLLPAGNKSERKGNAALIIKKYIDDNFFVSKLSLEVISNELSYSPKYISTVFKKNFGIGIIEYLNTIRIQHACTLIRQGFTSIYDISVQCGYSEPQYFSKIFKKKLGVVPSEYIKDYE